MIRGVFQGELGWWAFFCWKRNCEQYIFRDIQKIIDFPEVLSDFTVQVAGLNEQEQGAGKVDDEPYHEPEMRLLIDEDHLWFVHLVEQIEYGKRHDQNGFDGSRQRIETKVLYCKVIQYGEYVKYNGWGGDDDPEYPVADDDEQDIRKDGVFDDGKGAEYVEDGAFLSERVESEKGGVRDEGEDYIKKKNLYP